MASTKRDHLPRLRTIILNMLNESTMKSKEIVTSIPVNIPGDHSCVISQPDPGTQVD